MNIEHSKEDFCGSYGNCSKFATLETTAKSTGLLEYNYGIHRKTGGPYCRCTRLDRGFVKHQMSETKSRIVDITTVTGQAHPISDGDGRWLVNSLIIFRTFNHTY